MSLTLGEWRKMVAKFDNLPDDAILVIAKNREGNHFSPLDEVDEGMYLAETTYFGEHYMTEEQRQAQGRPDDYEEAPEDAQRAIFL